MIHREKCLREKQKSNTEQDSSKRNKNTEDEEEELQREPTPPGASPKRKQKKRDIIQKRRRKPKKLHRKRYQKDKRAEQEIYLDRYCGIPEESEDEEEQREATGQPEENQEQNADQQPSGEERQDQTDTPQIEERDNYRRRRREGGKTTHLGGQKMPSQEEGRLKNIRRYTGAPRRPEASSRTQRIAGITGKHPTGKEQAIDGQTHHEPNMPEKITEQTMGGDEIMGKTQAATAQAQKTKNKTLNAQQTKRNMNKPTMNLTR